MAAILATLPAAQVSLGMVLGCFAIAIFAPLLVSDVALLWSDETGWSSPWFASLWNRTLYPQYYDILFNVMTIVTLPLLVVMWLLRHRWSMSRRLTVSAATVLGVWVLVMIPWGSAGALWQKRPLPQKR